MFHFSKSAFGIARFLTFLTLGSIAAFSQTTGTSNVTVSVAPEASISINTPTSTLSASSSFADFTGATAFTYKLRTSASTGSGNIQLEVTTDFSPANGPSVASPLTGSDRLSYTCTVASPGTGCSGSQTASTTTQTPVATFGADAHTAVAGNSGSITWNLTNDPQYKPNTYTAVVTFTISAT